MSKMEKKNTWHWRVTQGVASTLIVAAAGCGKTYEAEMVELAQDAAQRCTQKSTTPIHSGVVRSGGLRVSVSCDIAKDESAVTTAATEAAGVLARVKPGETKIYHSKKGFMVSRTVPPTVENPLANAFSAAAPSASSDRERVKRNSDAASSPSR